MPSKDFKEVGVDSQLVVVHFGPLVVGLLCMVLFVGVRLLYLRLKKNK
jgi:uncharacterized integral membrane protein